MATPRRLDTEAGPEAATFGASHTIYGLHDVHFGLIEKRQQPQVALRYRHDPTLAQPGDPAT
jgi:hypothetical protein